MAIRKVGSRRIVADGIAYRWRIRRRATYWQECHSVALVVAVERAEQPGAVLVLVTDHPHPANVITPPAVERAAIRPARVAEWVRQALQRGWNPADPARNSCCG